MTVWIVIGISGVTCSGKSTVAKMLHESIKNSIYINQDCYFLATDDSRHMHIVELDHHNWDIITSLDMEKMYIDILKVMGSSNDQKHLSDVRILIIDGFLIYDYKPIVDLCHLKYFLTLTKQQCLERRKSRLYDPPDVPDYFLKVVWPEFLKYKKNIEENKELYETIIFIDGELSLDEIFQKIFTDISVKIQN